jgi:hypothetical protein
LAPDVGHAIKIMNACLSAGSGAQK